MLPKAVLTSHSRISGSRWVITSSWLLHSIAFLYFFALIIEKVSYLSLLLFGILHSNNTNYKISFNLIVQPEEWYKGNMEDKLHFKGKDIQVQKKKKSNLNKLRVGYYWCYLQNSTLSLLFTLVCWNIFQRIWPVVIISLFIAPFFKKFFLLLIICITPFILVSITILLQK